MITPSFFPATRHVFTAYGWRPEFVLTGQFTIHGVFVPSWPQLFLVTGWLRLPAGNLISARGPLNFALVGVKVLLLAGH